MILAVVFVVIAIVGIIGNLLALFVIGVNRQLRDSTNLLLCNLALADLLFLIFCVPITAYGYVYSWHFSESICYITVTLQYVTCYVSVWTLVLLAYDRYISVTNQQSRRIRRNNGVIYVCAAVWLIVFALNFFQMRDVGVLSFQYNGTMLACVDSISIATETSSVLNARLFYWSFNLGAYVLPLALSTLFYILLVRSIWKQKIANSKSSEKMKRHATKMVFVVIFTFGLCWFPQNTRFFLRGYNYPNMMFWERNAELLLVVQSTFQVIAYANSCLNPILYGALSERFRMGLSRAWRQFLCGYCLEKRSMRYYHTASAPLFNSPACGDSLIQREKLFLNGTPSPNKHISPDITRFFYVKSREKSSGTRIPPNETNVDIKQHNLRGSAVSLVKKTKIHDRLRSLLSLRHLSLKMSSSASCVRVVVSSENAHNSSAACSATDIYSLHSVNLKSNRKNSSNDNTICNSIIGLATCVETGITIVDKDAIVPHSLVITNPSAVEPTSQAQLDTWLSRIHVTSGSISEFEDEDVIHL